MDDGPVGNARLSIVLFPNGLDLFEVCSLCASCFTSTIMRLHPQKKTEQQNTSCSLSLDRLPAPPTKSPPDTPTTRRAPPRTSSARARKQPMGGNPNSKRSITFERRQYDEAWSVLSWWTSGETTPPAARVSLENDYGREDEKHLVASDRFLPVLERGQSTLL